MKTVTMLEFRRNAGTVLNRVARGERLILSYHGKPAARLEPIETGPDEASENDPFLTIRARARPAPKGPTPHSEIDAILYGGD